MDEGIKRKKVLVVDDDVAIGRILGRVLGKMDREHSMALSAEQARLMLKKEAFDLMLCDIHLPGESGMDQIKYVAAAFLNTAIIMVSGADASDTFEMAMEIGAYGYIVKPFKISEVIINVSSAFRRQRLEVESRSYSMNLEQTVAERTTKLLETLDGVIQVVSQIVETRDAYTAGHQRSTHSLAKAAGAAGFIVKPFVTEDVLEKIKAVLKGSTP